MSTNLSKLHLFLREHSFYILVFSSILACSFFAWRFFYSGSFRDFARVFAHEVDSEAQLLFGDEEFREQSQDLRANRRVFAATSRLADRLMYRFARRAVSGSDGGDHGRSLDHRFPTPRALGQGLREGAGHLGATGLVLFLALPYYYGFHSQNKSKRLLSEPWGKRWASSESSSLLLFCEWKP